MKLSFKHFLLSSCLVTAVGACASSQDGKTAAAPPVSGSPVLFASFDAAKGGLPEGLVLQNGRAFVGFAPVSEIVRVDMAAGKVEAFGSLPKPVPNKGFMTGLHPGSGGSILAALVSFAPEVQAGIYRLGAEGGAATLYAKHAEMAFPNGFTDDGSGGQFVTDSAAGAIFKLSGSGTLTKWHGDASLAGNQDFCGKGVGAGFDIGANGIARTGNTLFVANNDRASIISIAIKADGSPGETKVLAGPDCDNLGGADGLVIAPDGSLVVAANRLNKLVGVGLDGKVRVIAAGTPLDFPASVGFDGAALIATNFALSNASSGKPAMPGLIRIGAAH